MLTSVLEMEPFLNLNDVMYNHYFFIGSLFLIYLIYRIISSLFPDYNYMQTNYKAHGHTWRSIQCNKSIPYNIHCTNCDKLMLATIGLFCECCAASACKRCHRIIDKKFKCKLITWPEEKPFYHQWVCVNVGIDQSANESQSEDSLKRYYCSWCQRTKWTRNETVADTEQCDFQKYRNIIIPPKCVLLEKGKVTCIKHPGYNDWEPLIILANPKSGSNRSDEVLSLFRGLLNPIQVVDISSTSPENVVRWLPPKCRVLVAGGDGTVAWVLNSLLAYPKIQAAVSILPMGTGNDLSRVLGWGTGDISQLDAHNIITSVRQADLQPLDRWKVTITPKRTRLGRLRQQRVLYAHNYTSIGVDAQVALDFHHARAQFLYRYANRTLNYMAYVCLGAGRALDAGACGGLERRLRVWAAPAAGPAQPQGAAPAAGPAQPQGAAPAAGPAQPQGAAPAAGPAQPQGAAPAAGPAQPQGAGPTRRLLTLPPLQALVALNIPSWGAGVDLWRMGNEEDVAEQSISDGQLEVVGISSSFHIARLQCGLAEPYRFTQTSSLKIELEGTCAMQVDGEPWMQGPATILIEPAGQSLVLHARPESE